MSLNRYIRIGNAYLDETKTDDWDRRIKILFLERKPFLKISYTLRDLARDLGISLHHLSAFINQHYGIHFNEFINRHRIDYFITHITKEELQNKKLDTIAKEFGFSNRNTFRIAFKKITGSMPSKYLRSK